MKKIVKYVILDILKNKIIIAYAFFLLLISFSVFSLENNPTKGLLSLITIVLIIVPLISIIFSTIYVYNASEFIELMVSQPIRRSGLWLSIFAGLSIALMLAFLIGVGIPIMLFHFSQEGLVLIISGLALTLVFVSIALLASVYVRDKAKGIGVAILLWLYFALIFDSLVLFLLFQFADYPMEKAMIVFASLNPVDLARIMLLLKLDISAMMGYTQAVFRQFFGSGFGMVYSSAILLMWMVIPTLLSLRRFVKKDL
jgi:Cu-processing system permease protein